MLGLKEPAAAGWSIPPVASIRDAMQQYSAANLQHMRLQSNLLTPP